MTTKKVTNTPPENQIPAPKNGDGEIEGQIKTLDIKIQNLTSQLMEARGKLRELRGETVGTTKSAKAIEHYKNNPGKARKECIQVFVTDLGFGRPYSNTMYGLIKTKEKAGTL